MHGAIILIVKQSSFESTSQATFHKELRRQTRYTRLNVRTFGSWTRCRIMRLREKSLVVIKFESEDVCTHTHTNRTISRMTNESYGRHPILNSETLNARAVLLQHYYYYMNSINNRSDVCLLANMYYTLVRVLVIIIVVAAVQI